MTVLSLGSFLGASQVVSVVKNLTIMQETQETQVQSLGREGSLEDGMETHSSILTWIIPMDRGPWWATVHRITKSWTWQNRCSTHTCIHFFLWDMSLAPHIKIRGGCSAIKREKMTPPSTSSIWLLMLMIIFTEFNAHCASFLVHWHFFFYRYIAEFQSSWWFSYSFFKRLISSLLHAWRERKHSAISVLYNLLWISLELNILSYFKLFILNFKIRNKDILYSTGKYSNYLIINVNRV